jgi:hypothetical protein
MNYALMTKVGTEIGRDAKKYPNAECVLTQGQYSWRNENQSGQEIRIDGVLKLAVIEHVFFGAGDGITGIIIGYGTFDLQYEIPGICIPSAPGRGHICTIGSLAYEGTRTQ